MLHSGTLTLCFIRCWALSPCSPRLDPNSTAMRALWTPPFISKEAEVWSASETCPHFQSCPDDEASWGLVCPLSCDALKPAPLSALVSLCQQGLGLYSIIRAPSGLSYSPPSPPGPRISTFLLGSSPSGTSMLGFGQLWDCLLEFGVRFQS